MAKTLKEEFCGYGPGKEPDEKTPHFPRSVCGGHWIESGKDHEDHPGESLVTHEHDVILRWAQERKAMPATVPGTRHEGRPGVLRFDFPGFGSHQNLEHVTWEEWLDTLDERKLVMVFQEHQKNGRMSNFFHMNSPYREHQ